MKKAQQAILALILCTSCMTTKYVGTLKLKCPATMNDAWTLVGAGAQNASVEYWCDGGCTVQVNGKTPGGTTFPGPTHEHGGVPPPLRMLGVNTADFICNGTGGTCEFRITELSATPAAVTEVERKDHKFHCGTGVKTIFTNPFACEVLVRVTVPPGCTSKLTANTGAATTITPPANSNIEKLVSFTGATSVSAQCGGTSTTGTGKCAYEVHAWR